MVPGLLVHQLPDLLHLSVDGFEKGAHREEFSQTLIRPLADVSAQRVLQILEKEGKKALAWMKREATSAIF